MTEKDREKRWSYLLCKTKLTMGMLGLSLLFFCFVSFIQIICASKWTPPSNVCEWHWIHWLHYEMMHHFVLSAKSLLGKSWRKSRFKHISKWPIRSGHGRCYLCHYSRNEFALISFASNAWFSRGVKLIQSQNLELYSNSSGVSVARMIETHSICNAKCFKGDPLSAKDTSINCEKFECILRANRHWISILRKMKQ